MQTSTRSLMAVPAGSERTAHFRASGAARYVAYLPLVLLALLLATGCGRQPQLGGDKQAFKTADALWTAVCAKRPKLIDDVAGRLKELHADGKLPDDAFQRLAGIVQQAKDSDWDGARIQLNRFWRGQRPFPTPPREAARQVVVPSPQLGPAGK